MKDSFKNYRKVVHCTMFFGEKVALAKVVKEAYHKGFWTDAGGKVEKDENIFYAIEREVLEETGMRVPFGFLEFIDCFVYPEREIKSFLFSVHFPSTHFKKMKNTEPDKQSDWKLFTIKEALKLKLMPSVKSYLEKIK